MMFSPYSRIDSIQLFDCSFVTQCYKCEKTCFSGLKIKLRYKFDMPENKTHIFLCRTHALQAVKCNIVDLPLDVTEFLFSQKYADIRQEYLSKLHNIEEFTPESLLDNFRRKEINYWHEDSSQELDRSIYSVKSLKTIESVAGKIQAVIYQNSEQRFQIRYFYQNYIELGEWDWKRENTDKVTFAGDIKSAKSIALLEIAQRLKQPIVQL